MTDQKMTILTILIILSIGITACSNKSVKPVIEVLEADDYITQDSDKELVIPSPSTNTGVVYGKIISKTTGKAPQANIFLSRNITAGQTEVPAMLSFSYQTNPRAEIDETGNFYFSNVPEGVYAITLWTPPNDAYFIPTEDGQDYLWVDVEAGQSFDIGEIQAP